MLDFLAPNYGGNLGGLLHHVGQSHLEEVDALALPTSSSTVETFLSCFEGGPVAIQIVLRTLNSSSD